MSFDRQQFTDDLVSLALLDVPWVHKGRSEIGMDCVAPPRYALEKQGVQLPEELLRIFDDYARPPDGQKMLETMRKWLIEITREELQPADLIVIFNRRNPCHVVVQMPGNLVAEAFESMDGSVSKFLIRALDPRHRIAACFRIPDFAT